MEMSERDLGVSFSVEEVKHCMGKVVEAAFENPQNILRLREAKSRAGSDMVKIMQFVFPIAIKIQQETMEQCGFHSDYEAAIRFTQSLQKYEKNDEELASMSARFKTIFMPPLFSQAQISPNNQQTSNTSEAYEGSSSGGPSYASQPGATNATGQFQ